MTLTHGENWPEIQIELGPNLYSPLHASSVPFRKPYTYGEEELRMSVRAFGEVSRALQNLAFQLVELPNPWEPKPT
jgi:hypothetical protein